MPFDRVYFVMNSRRSDLHYPRDNLNQKYLKEEK